MLVDADDDDPNQLEGEIVGLLAGGALLHLDTEDAGTPCVDVSDGAEVFRVFSRAGRAEVDAIDRSQLRPGDQVSVFGDAGEGCLQADTVIVLDER